MGLKGAASPAPAPTPSSAAAWSSAEDDHIHSFAEWMKQRPPMWRWEAAGQGFGWDFPPTKAEKRELLLLGFLAEEAAGEEARQQRQMDRRCHEGGA